MKYLLDTNICIYIINHKPIQVLEKFSQLSLGEMGISSITAAELAYGVAKSGSARNQQALEKFLLPLEICPFDDKSIWHYGRIRTDLEKLGQTIGCLDMLIAAHALQLNSILVTNNTREFARVTALKLENWVEVQ